MSFLSRQVGFSRRLQRRRCLRGAGLVLSAALGAGAQPRPPQGAGPGLAIAELRELRAEVAVLALALQHNAQTLEGLQRDTKNLAREVEETAERTRALLAQPVLAAGFLAAPPAGSDALGVAKAPVFEPLIAIDSIRRHDTLFLKLRRVEPGGVRPVAELELGGSENTLALPLDRNGALYVLEWSTSEGHAYTLALRDGASEQTAASVQVRPLATHGRFLFVGSRLE